MSGEDDQQGEHGENEGRRPKTPPPVIKSSAPVASTTPTPTPKPTLTVAQPPLVLKPGSSVIQKSITCVKGSVKKIVKGLNPKCPTGYTLKKP